MTDPAYISVCVAEETVRFAIIMNPSGNSFIHSMEGKTYDIAEGNDIEERGRALGGFNVLVGENVGGLAHGIGELSQFLDCLHRLIPTDLTQLRFPATDSNRFGFERCFGLFI